MIKLLLILSFTASALAGWIPASHYKEKNTLGIYRHFQRTSPWTVMMAEVISGEHQDSQKYQSIKLGAYHRLNQRVHVGAFIDSQKGLRHNDDWTKKGASDWYWRDTSERHEETLSLLGLLRFDLPIPNSMFEWRNMFNFNLSNGQQSFRPRLAVVKAWEGFGQIFSALETYIPLNYDYRDIYENWIYLGFLFEINQNWKIGPQVSFVHRRWVENDEVKAADSTRKYDNKLEEIQYALQLQSHF